MTLMLSTFAGATTWSLLEYIIHRWFSHHPRLLKNPFGVEHTAHHSKGNHFAPSWKKIVFAGLGVPVTLGPTILLLGMAPGIAYVAGLIGFYLIYEAFHRFEHIHEGWGPYSRWARRHHFYHHFHNPKVNYGVTSPIWDWIFGTYVPVDTIRVPEKLKMQWLCDPETGEVWPHLQTHYALRRRRRSAA
jgi:sterol desaturase/sphingolipid hydroxylase (fatty acid hydroxylase superfamily)